jgi:hypothetical protein
MSKIEQFAIFRPRDLNVPYELSHQIRLSSVSSTRASTKRKEEGKEIT